jgi:hypothetical protein
MENRLDDGTALPPYERLSENRENYAATAPGCPTGIGGAAPNYRAEWLYKTRLPVRQGTIGTAYDTCRWAIVHPVVIPFDWNDRHDPDVIL